LLAMGGSMAKNILGTRVTEEQSAKFTKLAGHYRVSASQLIRELLREALEVRAFNAGVITVKARQLYDEMAEAIANNTWQEKAAAKPDKWPQDIGGWLAEMASKHHDVIQSMDMKILYSDVAASFYSKPEDEAEK